MCCMIHLCSKIMSFVLAIANEEAMQSNLPKCNRKRKRVLDDLICDEEAPSCSSMLNSCGDSESTDSKGFLLVGIPSSIKKTKEDSTPLPDPFPLPTNFRPDVHLCLEKKNYDKICQSCFLYFCSSRNVSV